MSKVLNGKIIFFHGQGHLARNNSLSRFGFFRLIFSFLRIMGSPKDFASTHAIALPSIEPSEEDSFSAANVL
jgi:hypothetical protein